MKRKEVIKFLEIYEIEKQAVAATEDAIAQLLYEYVEKTNTQQKNRYMSNFVADFKDESFSLDDFIVFCADKAPNAIESFMQDRLKDNSPNTRLIRRLLGESDLLSSLTPINSVPQDVVKEISSYLDSKSLYNLSKASKKFSLFTKTTLEKNREKYFITKLLKLSVNPDHLARMESGKLKINYKKLYENISKLPKYMLHKESIQGLMLPMQKYVSISELDYKSLLWLSGDVALIREKMPALASEELNLPKGAVLKIGINFHSPSQSIHVAIMTRSYEVIEEALRQNNKDISDLLSPEFLNHIALVGCGKILKKLLPEPYSNFPASCLNDNVNLFHYAAESGDLETIKFVEEIFDKLKCKNNIYKSIKTLYPSGYVHDDYNALNCVVESGNDEAIKYFVQDLNYETFTSPYMFNGKELYILSHAFMSASIQSINLIIARLKYEDKYNQIRGMHKGQSMLPVAATRGNVKIMDLAFKQAGIPFENRDFNSILKTAICSRDPATVEYCIKLMKRNCAVNEFNNNHHLYLEAAINSGSYEVVPILRKEGAYSDVFRKLSDDEINKMIEQSYTPFKAELRAAFDAPLELKFDEPVQLQSSKFGK